MKRFEIKRYKNFTFDKKMKWFISIAIVAAALIITSISTVSALLSIEKKSKAIMQQQVDTLADTVTIHLENYKESIIALNMDSSVQAYLKSDTPDSETLISINKVLYNLLNMQANSRFVVLLPANGLEHFLYRGDFLYRGKGSITRTNFTDAFGKDYLDSFSTGKGTMKINFSNAYFDKEVYSLNIYQPIYDTNKIGQQIGLLCINVNADIIEKLFTSKNETSYVESYFIHKSGKIIFYKDMEKIGTEFTRNAQLIGERGSFITDHKLYIYKKIENWDFYIVEYIPIRMLYEEGIGTMVLLIASIAVLIIVSLILSSRIVSKNYEPLDKIINRMGKVSNGMLDVRIREEQMGDDFKKIARGFNSMMDKIEDLMDQVKREQQQAAQIRFNALQSQIQPHFLYNTLEGIHWKAVANKDKELSTFVLALANYYRICLSKGRDIIPLYQEIAHVKNYLIIQNIRYGDIIQASYKIPESLREIQIPKMTLQPLVENAIYHGIKVKNGKTGTIHIHTYKNKTDIYILVKDNGCGMTEKEIEDLNNSLLSYDESFGYGIQNVNKRIALIFGQQYGLRYFINREHGITVQIKLPEKESQI